MKFATWNKPFDRFILYDFFKNLSSFLIPLTPIGKSRKIFPEFRGLTSVFSVKFFQILFKNTISGFDPACFVENFSTKIRKHMENKGQYVKSSHYDMSN